MSESEDEVFTLYLWRINSEERLENVDLMLINILFHVRYRKLKSIYIDRVDQSYFHNTAKEKHSQSIRMMFFSYLQLW